MVDEKEDVGRQDRYSARRRNDLYICMNARAATSVTLHLSFRDSHVFGVFLVVSGFPESWKPRFVTKSV